MKAKDELNTAKESGLISVIIPIYNREAVLSRAVDSILGQSYRNFELLLIDDGSEDGSYALCREYAEKDARIRAIRQEHGGVSRARNNGLLRSQGEFIFFLDSDDAVSPHILEKLHDDLIKHDADYVCCKYRQSPVNIDDYEMLTDDVVETDWRDALTILYFIDGYNYVVGTKLFRRNLIMEPEPILFADGCNFGEDSMWLSELLSRCRKAVIDKSCLMLYIRDCDNSLCKKVDILALCNHVKWKITFLQTHGFPEDLIKIEERILDDCLTRLLLI
ncbi:MAG: glycosyltransferase [Clostridia bacterium]|nr:glycosyltransferase [Clostridia bacterium]